MGGEHELGATAKDLVELGTKATDEKISGVSQRLQLVENSISDIRASLSGAKERLEGIDARLVHLEDATKKQTIAIETLSEAVSKESGYKDGLKDGFRVLHWVTGILFAVAGGAITFVVQHLIKSP